jgi:hypothetical protein
MAYFMVWFGLRRKQQRVFKLYIQFGGSCINEHVMMMMMMMAMKTTTVRRTVQSGAKDGPLVLRLPQYSTVQ